MPLKTGRTVNCDGNSPQDISRARAGAGAKFTVINARFIRGRVSSRGVKALVIPRRRRFLSRSDLVTGTPASRECKTVVVFSRGFARRRILLGFQDAGDTKIPFRCVLPLRFPLPPPSPLLPDVPAFPSRRSRGALKFTPGYSSGNLTAPGRRFLPLCIPLLLLLRCAPRRVEQSRVLQVISMNYSNALVLYRHHRYTSAARPCIYTFPGGGICPGAVSGQRETLPLDITRIYLSSINASQLPKFRWLKRFGRAEKYG